MNCLLKKQERHQLIVQHGPLDFVYRSDMLIQITISELHYFRNICLSLISNTGPKKLIKFDLSIFNYLNYIATMIITYITIGIFLYAIWNIFLETFFVYFRIAKVIGIKHTKLIYQPFSNLTKYHLENAIKFGNSMYPVHEAIKQNPEIRVILYHLLFFRVIILVDPKLTRQFSLNNQQKLQKNTFVIFAHQILAGLFTAEGDKWKKARKLLSNLFTFQLLKNRGATIEKIVQRETFNLHQNDKVNVFQFGRRIASQSLVETFLGEQFNAIRINNLKPHQQVGQIIQTAIIESYKLTYWARYAILGSLKLDSSFLLQSQKALRKRIIDFKNIFIEYLKSQQNKFLNKQEVTPFLKIYFQNKSMYSDIYEQIINQTWAFLFASQDPTSCAITIISYELANHLELQERLRIELQNAEDIHNNKMLNDFISESIRINTPVVFTVPRKVIASHSILDLPVQKGDFVSSELSINNRNPKYFDNPDQFNIDNFKNPIQNTIAFTPFYTGPRNCIGQHMAMMEVRLTIKHLLMKYRLIRNDINLKMVTRTGINLPLNSRLVTFEQIKG